MAKKNPTKKELEDLLYEAMNKELEWKVYKEDLQSMINNFSSNPPTKPPKPPKH